MARDRWGAHAPLIWAAIPGMRSLYEHLLERLPQLPRDAAGVLLRSAAACLRQVAAALLRLLRLLGGPAQSGLPTSDKARPQSGGNPPVRPGAEGGDAVKGTCLGGPAQAGTPISKKARGGPDKPPVRPGTQGGDAVKAACFAAPDSAPGVNKVAVLDGAEAPELAESDPTVAKNSCSEFGEVAITSTRTEPLRKEDEAEGSSHELLQDFSSPDDSIWDWELVKGKKRRKMAAQFQQPQVKQCTFYKKKGHLARDCPRMFDQEKCCTYCKKEGHLARDCPGIKASSSPISGCDPTRKGCHRKAKHVDEEKYNLDMLFAEEEEDAETKAHWLYHVKVCKKDHILCLACHLSGKEVLVRNKKEEMMGHCENKHGPRYHWCEKRGCLAIAETKHDIGLHQ